MKLCLVYQDNKRRAFVNYYLKPCAEIAKIEAPKIGVRAVAEPPLPKDSTHTPETGVSDSLLC